ncbi:AAA family ATPase [Polyangium sp. 15x6]|uniref:AAA family ATPase n=1 Tax=Polyangium sp. 15x6 TaxID=3042687 RepID=UPI00249B94BA|nr:AAA family ATPase [Polyangium sp. 15x6]MDI3291782.1 AAA family ATPase [Polyangium sp. 15x6]
MRLLVEMLEDPRGRRSIKAALFLHGLVEPSTDFQELARLPSKLVDSDQPGGGAHRPLAQLDLMAGDHFDEEWLRSVLAEGMHDALSTSAGDWVNSSVASARFLRADRVADEQVAILDELLKAAMTRLRRRHLRTALRILLLELTDYRGVDQLRFTFSSEQTTVLVGNNGAGKTTLLDAAALLLSHLEAGIRRTSGRVRAFTDRDIMNGRDGTKIAITAHVGDAPVSWSLSHARDGEPIPAHEREGLYKLDEEVENIRREVEQGDVCLPLVVYYPVNRAVLDIPLRIRTQHAFDPLEAYDGALIGDRRNFRLFFEWFRGREDLENERRIQNSAHRDNQLEAVRRAIESLMPGFTNLRVQRAPLGMVVQKADWTLYVDQLSDGEKCLLAMTGDLARRLAIANPYMDNPLEGGGVVIIDEVELHLHPSWQREIVPALERTFPNCQFIVTTHSPAVVGHVQRESLRLLKSDASGIRVEVPSVSFGLDANRVLLEIMGVDERPHDVKVQLEVIYTLIGEGKFEEARERIASLEAQIGGEPELTKAATIIRRKEAIGR